MINYIFCAEMMSDECKMSTLITPDTLFIKSALNFFFNPHPLSSSLFLLIVLKVQNVRNGLLSNPTNRGSISPEQPLTGTSCSCAKPNKEKAVSLITLWSVIPLNMNNLRVSFKRIGLMLVGRQILTDISLWENLSWITLLVRGKFKLPCAAWMI